MLGRLWIVSMRRKFEQLRANLEEFVQQDDYPMLAVGCLPDELAYVMKFLQSLEEVLPAHMIAVFHQPFPDAGTYLDGMLESVRVQLEALAPLRVERREPPIPALPLAVMDPRRDPSKRLIDLLDHLRLLLPNEDEYRLVIGLLPLQCKDPGGYAALIRSILPVPEPPAWGNVVRIVVYEDRNLRPLTPILQAEQAERVLTFDVDFSTDAMADALVDDASDRSLPRAERMLALTQLAAIDYSYKRYELAFTKYAALFDYYVEVEQPDMQALCLLGAGDTLHAAGESEAAKLRLQQGIALAMQHRSLAVLLNLLSSAHGVCMILRHYADAETYADAATRVSAEVLNPFANADSFEARGDAQVRQDKLAEAVASYQRCRELSRTYQYFQRWESVLGKLTQVYARAQMQIERRESEAELMSVRELGRHAHKVGVA